MTSDHDKSVQWLVQSLHDWTTSWGGVAWIGLGILLIAAPWMRVLSWRGIRKGGLKYQSTTQFMRRQQQFEQVDRNRIDRA
jgi:hypothetical protein